VLRPEIFTHARDWPRLTSTHPKVDGGPPPKKNRENLKLALKFSMLESITAGIVEVFLLNFFMRPAINARGICLPEIDCTRTCGAGRPHVWLCRARLVFNLYADRLLTITDMLTVMYQLEFSTLRIFKTSELLMAHYVITVPVCLQYKCKGSKLLQMDGSDTADNNRTIMNYK